MEVVICERCRYVYEKIIFDSCPLCDAWDKYAEDRLDLTRDYARDLQDMGKGHKQRIKELSTRMHFLIGYRKIKGLG